MNAVEKVAHFLAENHRRETVADPEVIAQYAGLARDLVAAFPQLALEGREENTPAYRGYDGRAIRFGSVYPYLADAQAEMREIEADEASRHESTNDWIVASRTVWESPWSEVQS